MKEETLFSEGPSRDARDAAIVAAYETAGRTLDDLPYTEEFERIMEYVWKTDPGVEHRQVFHRLHNLRKAGKLPRLGRGDTMPNKLAHEHETLLIDLVSAKAGSLGQRDQLPYTGGFDEVASEFMARTGLSLTHHDLWRVIAKLAK